ncbi:hypothetical protein [Aquabacterium sp.]|uniref:hypothetical protein n=1 Tax=Aquabacterium sp. TaxID=1872578 RepID=UPI002C569025|nr:hypothetical protein [Aquabacterium sp.]HSW06629.1 hypothetical protein [Aquabacterium sp.]
MKLRLALGLLAVVLYAVLSHFLMLYAASEPWAVAALFGPLLLPCLALAWRRRQPLLLGASVLAALALVLIVARGGLGDVKRLYLMQHAGTHLALGLVFLASLRGDGPSLITQMARRVHALSPAMETYTAHVTRLWVGYFFAMMLVSVAVYATLPWSTWSLLANVLTPLAIAVVFVGEHWARYRLHPEFERLTLAQVLHALNGASGEAARS